MLRRSRARAVLLAAVATLALVSPVAAAEFRTDRDVVVGADETVDDDLYIAAGTVIIDGTVNGDVTIGAGTITVNGTVNGAVNAGGGAVDVRGEVSGAVRASAGTVRIAGSVGRDVVVFAGNTTIEPTGQVAGDVAGSGGRLIMSGTIGGDLLAAGGTIDVNGTIDGSIDVAVGQLTIASGAVVSGDVTYTSSNEADIADGTVAGEVTRQEPAATPGGTAIISSNPILSYLGLLLGMLLLGWLLLALRPRLTLGSADALRTSPLLSLGIGLGTLIGQFVVLLVLVLLAALVGILAWSLGGAFFAVAIVLLLLVVLAIILSTIPVAMAIGRLILADRSPYLAYLVGAAILALVIVASSLVEVLGGLVYLIVWILGLGAFVVYLWRTRERPYLLVEPTAAPQPPAPAAPPA
jgi:cytoskeletal protein CcmA (bactofilin family)